MRIAEVPPDVCPNGHAMVGSSVLVGWDNRHEPPCRVYVCQVCEGRVWVQRIRYRALPDK